MRLMNGHDVKWVEDFNPRIPQGMRPCQITNVSTSSKFQSTHSAGNATITASREISKQSYFNPRIPQGMRRLLSPPSGARFNFNPRIPQGMRHLPYRFMAVPQDFNPRIPQGMRLSQTACIS